MNYKDSLESLPLPVNTDIDDAAKIAGVVIVTNETNLYETFITLKKVIKKQDITKQKCHIGVSCWFNLDIAYARSSDYILIIDHNKDVVDFMRLIVQRIKLLSSRQLFISFMKLYAQQTSLCLVSNFQSDRASKDDDIWEEVQMELKRKNSWLSSEASYQYIRLLCEKDRIAVIQRELLNCKNNDFTKIKNYLNSHDITIDTCYLSNVQHYFRKKSEKLRSFITSIDQLLLPNSTVIFVKPLKEFKTYTQENYLEQMCTTWSEYRQIIETSLNSEIIVQSVVKCAYAVATHNSCCLM